MLKEIGSRALDIVPDLVEPFLDRFIHNELVKELPVLGTAIKLAQASRSVADRIFLTKIMKFLENLDFVSPEEAREFAERLERDPKLAQRTGEVLLLSLDSMNDLEKAPVLAAVFAAYVRREIDLESFRRLNTAVGLAMVEDIWDLTREEDPRNLKESRERRLLALYALRITGLAALSDTAFNFVGKSSYIGSAITPLGEVLIDILKKSLPFEST